MPSSQSGSAEASAPYNIEIRSPTWGSGAGFIPRAPRWGPLPKRTTRSLFPFVGLRGPSPPPQLPGHSNVRGLWRFDHHPAYSGWNATAHGHAAALLLNAAYDAASQLNLAIPQVDFRWHRPDVKDVAPFGYNWRGDIAPPNIHDILDIILDNMQLLDLLQRKLLHAQIDLVWLLHSRSPLRCPIVIRNLAIFRHEDVAVLDDAIRREPLTDARLLMLALDPRCFPVYGRTMTSAGQSRLFHSFPDVLSGRANDHATWDEDDGGESGSSVDSWNAPYDLTPLERIERRNRELERRLRRALCYGNTLEQHVLKVEAETQRLEERYRRLLERNNAAHVLVQLLEAGLHALGPTPGVAEWRAASRGYRRECSVDTNVSGLFDDADVAGAPGWPPAV